MKLTIDPDNLTTPDGRPLRFTEDQGKFLRSMVQNLAMLGGFGSGKSLLLCFKAVLLSFVHGKGYRGQLISPTYDMLQRILIPTIRDDIMLKMGDRENGRSLWDLSLYSPSKRSLMMPNGFELLFGSADRPDRIRGSNLAFIGIDEATLIDQFADLYVSSISRLRRARPHPSSGKPMAQFFLVGTPEGEDKIQEKFEEGPEDPAKREDWRRTHQIMRISTLANPGINQDFIDQMMIGIPEPLIPAYLHGQHVNIGSPLAYYNFKRQQNVNRGADYDPALDLHISWDFNVSPMTCTVHQIRGYGSGGRRGLLMTIDEIVMNNSNTPAVCREFIRRYGNEGRRHRRAIHIYGDASDKVGVSNYDEIEDYLRGHFTGTVSRRVPNTNPLHYRRLKSVNALCRNALGEVRWLVNPRCRALIRDLTTQRMDRKSQNSKDKKQEAEGGGTLGHSSDTVDYLVDRLFPFHKASARDVLAKTRMLDHLIS